MHNDAICNIGSRRELFVDHYLIEKLEGLRLELQKPLPAELAGDAFADAGYATVIQDGLLYHAWYRTYLPDYVLTAESGYDGNPGEVTAYMLSTDGVHWSKPDLGLYELGGSTRNNAVLAQLPPFSHNFSPMLDNRPGVPTRERFKALAGVHRAAGVAKGFGKDGLHAFASPDGIHWALMQDDAVIQSDQFAFDSQNVSFWSESEGCYVCMYRSWIFNQEGDFKTALRSISRRTSTDYLHWSEEVPLQPNQAGEHLYTNQTAPYFRAPHIYISLPTRFMPERGDSTDILFMSSRGNQGAGNNPLFDRTFREAFIAPGLDPARWGNRSNYTALNVIPTSDNEMSIYLSSNNVKEKGRRLVLRTDGFASVHAGWAGGELLTRPLRFDGGHLEINYATSAAGSLQVEVQTMDGTPITGYTLEDSETIVGDEVSRVVCWRESSDVSLLAGKPVRLRFVMREADLFSLRFF